MGSQGMSTRVGVQPISHESVHQVHRGPPPGVNNRIGRGRRKKRQKNFRNMFLVVSVAFLFLFTPASDQVSNQFDKWWEWAEDQLGPARTYPIAASYTVERNVVLNNPSNVNTINFDYELPIPLLRTDFGIENDGFIQNNIQHPSESLQSISSMTARVLGTSNSVQIPLGNTDWPLLSDDAIDLDSNSRIYWPPIGESSNRCSMMKCAIWDGQIPPSANMTLVVTYSVTSYSFTWWGGDSAPSGPGKSNVGVAITENNAGAYGDYQDSSRGHLNTMYDQFGTHRQWYDRAPGPTTNWAIDANHPVVIEYANEIESSLSAEDQDSPFAFAHAAFVKIRDSIVYQKGGSPAKSGPACISDGRGDCDEQSNAWMSVLRTRSIPAWYEFGPMTDKNFDGWEPHAWANAIFPLDQSWCESNNIDISTCFVEGEVDVVNNRWLLHTPTTLTEWIEEPSYQGEGAYEFYRPLSIGCANCWTEYWNTVEYSHMSQGTFKVNLRIGE